MTGQLDRIAPIVLTDLDDTLFQTEAKTPAVAGGIVAAVDKEGLPRSYMTPPQASLFAWLSRTAELVPVTGRSVDAFDRVKVPFRGRAVCSFGGVVLDASGAPNPSWRARIAGLAAGHAARLSELRTIALSGPEDIRARVIEEDGTPIYLSLKHNAGNASELDQARTRLAAAAAPDWTLHLNANNMAVIPPGVSKASAAGWVVETLIEARLAAGQAREAIAVIAIGDSLSDLPFMRLGHLAAFPAHSQIAGKIAALGQQPLGLGAAPAGDGAGAAA